ncbi:uncharacterized protein LOC102802549 [Saccoglossus kowalevskii]|uniref:Uncharacterized protein LOC102802549 n=1 Tax=Saccoglossus kowalevskii TaxID=10224 RepID=A0ABM0MGJ2_SACKO|nr:PREDICTED: uncharacterized protein LOC102802549 [Saccoglossus kowalevskii]
MDHRYTDPNLSMRSFIKETLGAQGSARKGSHVSSDHSDVRRSTRIKIPTDKGFEYAMEINRKKLKSLCTQLHAMTDQILGQMETPTDVNVVRKKYTAWMEVYEEFLDTHDAYVKYLSGQEQWEFQSSWFEKDERAFQGFNRKVSDWISKQDSQSRKTHGISPEDSVSTVGTYTRNRLGRYQSSVASSRSSLLSAARLKEEQRKAELLARVAALDQRKKLEIERIQQEEAKIALKLREEKLALETEMAIAEAKTKVLDKFDDERSANSMHYARGDSVHNNCGPGFAGSVHDMRRVGGLRSDSDSGSLVSNHKSSDEVILAVVRELKKPQSDINKFSGIPMQYRKFMRQFTSRVVANTSNAEELMNYLELYTVGEANKIVTGYGNLSPEQGYPAARRELEERYGDNEMIANSYVEEALRWPSIKAHDVKALDAFSIFLQECEYAVQSIDAVKIIQFPQNMASLVKKLPSSLQEKWRGVVQGIKERGDIVEFGVLVKFIKKEAKKVNDPIYGKDALRTDHEEGKNKDGNQRRQQSRASKASFATVTDAQQNTQKQDPKETSCYKENEKSATDVQQARKPQDKPCIYCDGTSHAMEACRLLAAQSHDDRISFLKSKGLCFGCLKIGHQKKYCRFKETCVHCKRLHPTLLHIKEKDKSQNGDRRNGGNSKVEPGPVSAWASMASMEQCYMGAGDGECTMTIVHVKIRVKHSSRAIETYAFLDPGSSINFCTESLVRNLGLSGRKVNITLDTMGVPHVMNTYIVHGLEVCDLQCKNAIDLPKVYTKDKMPVSRHYIPTQDDISHWSHLQGVHVPQINADVGLLIGNAIPDAYMPLEIVTGPQGSPHASRTRLGWTLWNVVCGEDNREQGSYTVNRADIIAVQESEELKQLDLMVRSSINFDFPERAVDDKREPSQEDKMFTMKVNESISYVNGHYQISLPFRDDDVKLPNNKEYATKRLKGIEKKLRKYPEFYMDYTAFMESIISKGYAVKVHEDKLGRSDGKVWYVPHHGVYHPRKPGKIRVVFDCAARFQGTALNDHLLQGPDLTNNLLGVLLRFRQEPVALMADIEAMFHQVWIPKGDCDCLRFLWWPNGDLDRQPEVYAMTVHLFGAVSSPSCANTALQRTAEDNKNFFGADVVNTVLRNFYVDDCLKSVESETKAISLVHDLRDLCQRGGFNLTKWMSNSRVVLESIQTEERSKGS